MNKVWKWLVLLLVALPVTLPAAHVYGVDFETLVGEDCPTLTQADFYQYWKLRVIPARNAEFSNITYTATYYVDTGSTDGGTGRSTATSGADRAFATIGAVNSAISSSSGYIRVLFKRDQRHSSTVGIQIDNKDGIYIGAYGSGRKPVLHCFTLTRSSSWTDGSDGAFYISQASAVGWIRDATNEETRLSPFRYRDSLAEVQAEARTWWWDDPNDRLYVNVDDSSNPGTTTYEYSLESSNDHGCQITDSDLVLVEGLQFDGWGANLSGTSSYAVRADGDVGRVIVRDCDGYYCGSHAFGTTGGGICLFQRCSGGYLYNGASATTTYVAFEDTIESADECIFDECIARFGHLPNDSLASGVIANHQGFYAHNGTSGAFGLLMCIDCREPAEHWRTNWTATMGDLSWTGTAGDGTPSTIRSYSIGHIVNRQEPGSGGKWSFRTKVAYVGCRWHQELASTDSGNNFYLTQDGGHCYRCILSMRDRRTTSTIRYLFNSSGAVTLNNCTFFLDGPLSTSRFTMASAANTSFVANDCFLIRPSACRVMNGLGNNSSQWTRVAIAGADPNTSDAFGFGNALSLTQCVGTPTRGDQSPIGTLAETGASVNGPAYDANWRRCGSGRSFGAVEANPEDMAELDTILARIGPWTGDTPKNSVYGALRAMANADVDFTSPDLTQDDGDGAGTFNNENASLGGIRSITALAVLQEDAGVATGGSTTTIVGPASWSTVDDKYVGAKVVVYFAANAAAANDVRTVIDYVGATRTATVEPAFAAAVGAGDVAFILRGSMEQLTTSGQSAIAAATWDKSRASHVAAGSFGEGVASVQGNVTGNVAGSTASVTAGVTLADGAITAAKFATDSISAAALAAATGTEIANAIWDKPHTENIAVSSKGQYLNSVGVYQTTLYGQMEDALEAYRLDELMVNPLSPQPASGSLFGDLTEDDGGDQRFRSNSLELAPTGSGGSGDPLANAVPGAYASGTAGWVLGRVRAGAVTVIAPVSQDGQTLTLVKGDDYANLDGRALQWTTSAASEWPTLTGATITLTIHSASMTLISQAGTVVTDTGANKSVRAELTDTQTSTLTAETYSFDVKAVLSNGNVATLVRGKVKVLQD